MKPSPCGRMLLQPTSAGWECIVTDVELRPTMQATIPARLDVGPFHTAAISVPLYPAAGAGQKPRTHRRRGRLGRWIGRGRLTLAAVYLVLAGWSGW